MGERHEVQRMPAGIGDLDHRGRLVGLHDGPDGARRPPTGLGEELDDIVLGVALRHRVIVAAGHGMSTQIETNRGGRSLSTSQIVATGCVAPFSPSTGTTTS